jgi:hypothetical protein
MSSKLSQYLLVKLSQATKRQRAITRREDIYDLEKDLDVAQGILDELKKRGEIDSETFLKFHNKIALLRDSLKEKEKNF